MIEKKIWRKNIYLFCKVIVLRTPAIFQTPNAVKVLSTTIVVNGSTKTIPVSI